MSSTRTLVTSYADCADFLNARGNGRGSRKLTHNTYLVMEPLGDQVSYAVILHHTAVVIFYRDGSIRLSTGGWHTVTTKNRINRCLPPGFRLASVRRCLKLYRHPAGEGRYFESGDFWDGMTLEPDGTTYRVRNPNLHKGA